MFRAKYVLFCGLTLVLNSSCGSSEAIKAATATAATTTSSTSSIKVIRQCSKVDTVKTLTYKYETVTYTSGDRFVYCEVGGTGASFGASFIYQASQTGADNGACSVVADVDTATAGWWNFTSPTTGSSLTIRYNDPGSASDGYQVVIPNSSCYNG